MIKLCIELRSKNMVSWELVGKEEFSCNDTCLGRAVRLRKSICKAAVPGWAGERAESLDRGHSRKHSECLSYRQREMWTPRGKGLLFPTGSMFLFAYMLVRMENSPGTVKTKSGEQCMCLFVSKGEGSSISVSSAHMATYGLTKTEKAAILSLDVIWKPSLIK